MVSILNAIDTGITGIISLRRWKGGGFLFTRIFIMEPGPLLFPASYGIDVQFDDKFHTVLLTIDLPEHIYITLSWCPVEKAVGFSTAPIVKIIRILVSVYKSKLDI